MAIEVAHKPALCSIGFHVSQEFVELAVGHVVGDLAADDIVECFRLVAVVAGTIVDAQPVIEPPIDAEPVVKLPVDAGVPVTQSKPVAKKRTAKPPNKTTKNHAPTTQSGSGSATKFGRGN